MRPKIGLVISDRMGPGFGQFIKPLLVGVGGLFVWRINPLYVPITGANGFVTVTLNVCCAVCAGRLESFTVTRKLRVPSAVGVPLSTFFVSFNPAGSPLPDQVYVPLPFTAWKATIFV